MIDVSYEFYKMTTETPVSEQTFNILKVDSQAYVDYYTDNYFSDKIESKLQDNVVYKYKVCVCRLIDEITHFKSQGDGVVLSRRAGQTSETYVASSVASSKEAAYKKLIILYLDDFINRWC